MIKLNSPELLKLLAVLVILKSPKLFSLACLQIEALFNQKDTEIRPVQVLTLCQLLTGRMGSTPILPVTIGTMLKLECAEFRCRYM